MRGLIAITLFAFASAQIFKLPFWNRNEKDSHGGYTFEYHDRHHLLIVRDNSVCYLIDAKPEVVNAFHDNSTRAGIEDDIINHIKAKQDMHEVTHFSALTHFHDPLQAAECVRRSIVELKYTLPGMTPSTPPTTAKLTS